MENRLSVPIAIVIAGVLIAGALYFTRGDVGSSTKVAEISATKAINFREVSGDDHILGNPKADVLIVEYSDTECPFCKQFHTTMHRIIDTYGKDGSVAWVYRHFPIDDLHPKARKESQATECAYEQGGNAAFWKYIDRIFEITPSNNGLDSAKLPEIATEIGLNRQKFETCLASGTYADKVEADYQDAIAAGGRGTPYNILISGEKFSDETIDIIRTAQQQLPPRTLNVSEDEKKLEMVGALPYDLIKLILDSILKSSR